MGRYLARRLGAMLLLVIGIVTITFFITRLIPGDPARIAAGLGASEETVSALRARWGLDRPLPEQYARFMGRLAHMDLGNSIVTGRSVAESLRKFGTASLELATYSFLIYMALGLGIGVASAGSYGRWVDTALQWFAVLTLSVPFFWLALLLQIGFYFYLGWFPAGGRLDPNLAPPPTVTGFYTIDSLLAREWATFFNSLRHLALPVTAIVLSRLGVIVRITRISFAEELHKGYVRTAQAKGLPKRDILWRHIPRNALNPVISVAGVQLGYLIGGLVLIEWIYSWPGLGSYAVSTISSLDYPGIIGVTLVISIAFVLINLCIDILYGYLDPRIKMT